MATQSTPQQWLDFFLDEQNSALLYQTLAKVEKDERISNVYLRIADTEIRHAAVWSKKLEDAGKPVPVFKPTWQTRMLIWLSHRFGPNMILPTIQNMEQQGSAGYAGVLDANGMQGEEQSHDFLVSQIKSTVTGGLEGGVLAQLEGRHRSAGGNALRAAVLGANDGLVFQPQSGDGCGGCRGWQPHHLNHRSGRYAGWGHIHGPG